MILGGVFSALSLWVLGAFARDFLPTTMRFLVLAGVCAALFVRETGLVDFRLPQNRRQISQSVPARGASGYLQFGFELGTGVRTYLPSALPHLLAASLLLVGQTFTDFLAAGLAFGVGRGVALLTLPNQSGLLDQWRTTELQTQRRFKFPATVAGVLGLGITIVGGLAAG